MFTNQNLTMCDNLHFKKVSHAVIFIYVLNVFQSPFITLPLACTDHSNLYII